jgi:hypothetical protein
MKRVVLLVVPELFLIAAGFSSQAQTPGAPVSTSLRAVELPWPAASRSVRALAVGEDGRVHGAAFGKEPWLFTYDPPHGKLTFSLSLFKHRFEGPPAPYGTLTAFKENRFVVSYRSPPDNSHQGMGGMHVWQSVPPANDDDTGFRSIATGSGSFVALAGDPRRSRYYALTADGAVLCYQIQGKRLELVAALGRTFANYKPGAERKSLPALVLDARGAVYTTGDNGVLLRGSVEGKPRLDSLGPVPAAPGRESAATLTAAVLSRDGLIYGGTSDGYLFTLNPQTDEISKLGKPFRGGRMQGLAISRGKLIGVGGDQAPPQAFILDLKSRAVEKSGALQTADGKTVSEPIGALVADREGNIYLGTTGMQGKLYIWAAR